jgi:hypothetical protein
MEKLFIVIDFLLPLSIKTGKVKSTNLFFKLQIATLKGTHFLNTDSHTSTG